MYSWKKPCPGRDAIRAGLRHYDGKVCERCGLTRRYASGGACVECARLSTYLAMCLPEGWQDESKTMKEDATVLSKEIGVSFEAAYFVLASLAVGCSGARIKRFTGMQASICFRYANRCQASGLWSYEAVKPRGTRPVLDYEFMDDDALSEAVSFTLICMVAQGALRRDREGRYSST